MSTTDINIEFTQDSKSNKTRGKIIIRQTDNIIKVDSFDIANAKKRKVFIDSLIKEYPGLENHRQQIDKQIQKKAAEILNSDKETKQQGKNEPLEISRQELEKTKPELINYAKKLLESPKLIENIINHGHQIGIAGEDNLIAALILMGTSRLLEKPLTGIIMGQSSAGKSYVIEKVSNPFPPETILKAHKISPTALQYMPPGSLKHRFIIAGERSRMQDDAAAEATRALREMISEGNLSTLVTCKNSTGPHSTAEVKQEGPISYIESTTLGITQLFNEDRTRFLLLCSDESQQQTNKIVQEMAFSISAPRDPDIPDSIIALHHTIQRLLKSAAVNIPYADKLSEFFLSGPVETRRTFGKLLSLIQAVTLLYQYQRDSNKYGLESTFDDYHIVKRYFVEPLARSMGKELTPGAKELLEVIPKGENFTAGDLLGKVSVGIRTIYSRLKELENTGQIEIVEYHKGSNPNTYRGVNDPPPMTGLILPDLSAEKKVIIMLNSLRTKHKSLYNIDFGVQCLFCTQLHAKRPLHTKPLY